MGSPEMVRPPAMKSRKGLPQLHGRKSRDGSHYPALLVRRTLLGWAVVLVTRKGETVLDVCGTEQEAEWVVRSYSQEGNS